MLNVAQAMAETAERLKRADIETARLDAELLVACVLNRDRAWLYTYPERPLTSDETAHLETLASRRQQREPLPHLLGRWEFYRRSFRVTPDTLIPRPETERLVEGSLARRPWSASCPPRVMDVGAGTGCIGLTLSAEVPEAILVLTDCSPGALEVAKQNAVRFSLTDRVEFRLARFPEGTEDLKEQLDLIVSNPPYIAESDRDSLPPEVRRYEPEEALFAGPDGLDMIRDLLDHGRSLLRPGGWIALEFGIGQAEKVRRLAEDYRYRSVALENDLAGIPRALFARTPLNMTDQTVRRGYNP